MKRTSPCLKIPLCIPKYLMPLKFLSVGSSKVKANKRKIFFWGCIGVLCIYIDVCICVYVSIHRMLYKCGAESNSWIMCNLRVNIRSLDATCSSGDS